MTQASQPHPDDMNGLDDSPRESDREQQRHHQGGHEGGGGGAHGPLQLVTDEQRGETDPNRPKRLFSEEDGLVNFQDGLGVDTAKLSERATTKKLVQIEAAGQRRALECGRAVHNGASGGVDDHGIDDVGRVRDARLEDGPHTGVGTQCCYSVGRLRHDAAGKMKDRASHQLAARPALFQAPRHDRAEVQRRQSHHAAGDERRDRDDLSAAKADTHAPRCPSVRLVKLRAWPAESGR